MNGRFSRFKNSTNVTDEYGRNELKHEQTTNKSVDSTNVKFLIKNSQSASQIGAKPASKKNRDILNQMAASSSSRMPDQSQVSDSVALKMKQKRDLHVRDIDSKNFQATDKRNTINIFLRQNKVKMYFFELLFPRGYSEYWAREDADQELKCNYNY